MQGFNKYYPPDYDPQKHSSLNAYRGKHALGDRARKIDQGILITRFELPYNIWCDGCNNHIGMGVRYNAEKKKVGNYYSTPIYEFRCKCHLCDNWFTIETDPKNTRYVVTSGARQKNEEWDPEENGGFAIYDPDKAGPSDPLAALEKTTQAQIHQNKVEVPRLDALQSLSEQYNADPYTQSLRVRKQFRITKKLDKEKKDADDAVKNKYALPDELALVADDESIKEEAHEAFSQAKKERVLEESAIQRRIAAETGLASTIMRASGPIRTMKSTRIDRGVKTSRPSTTALSGTSSSLRNRLLQNTRKPDSFIGQNKSKPPDARTLGIIMKKS